MISPQPIQLWRYLGFKRNKLSNEYKRLFYLSWEDALWDLLSKKKVPKNSTILVPDFFCGDVEDNMRNHGYKVSHYKILKNLRVDIADFKNKIKKLNPKVVIVFHSVGIKSNIDLKIIGKEIILIEDCVHQIINLSEIKILRKNHFIIDSFRKVIPLQGSNLIGRKEDLNFDEPLFFQSIVYSMKVHIKWLLMLIFLNLGLYKFAENQMMAGYDLIGDSKLPARGLLIFKFLSQFIDYKKINRIKYSQIQIYNKYLKTDIKFTKGDWGNMRGYPTKISEDTLGKLRKNNLLVRYELSDSIWSRKNKIVYLPLGPHISQSDILEIVKLTGELKV